MYSKTECSQGQGNGLYAHGHVQETVKVSQDSIEKLVRIISMNLLFIYKIQHLQLWPSHRGGEKGSGLAEKLIL